MVRAVKPAEIARIVPSTAPVTEAINPDIVPGSDAPANLNARLPPGVFILAVARVASSARFLQSLRSL